MTDSLFAKKIIIPNWKILSFFTKTGSQNMDEKIIKVYSSNENANFLPVY